MLPHLATRRLDLRPARPDDLDALHALWAAPEVRRYLFDDEPVTRERAAEVLARATQAERDGLGLWMAWRRDGGAPAGCAGLLPVTTSAAYDPWLSGEIEPIVALAPEAWSQGLAHEALAGLIQHAFAGLGLARLAAVVDVPNERSDRLVRRLGFVATGEAPGPRYRMRTYALTRERWTLAPHADRPPVRPGTRGYNRARMDAPLAGLLVADLTQNIAGPYCTQILGDMGAEVVKIERLARGDDARAWAPPYWGAESATFMTVNRNKRSVALDMKAPAGREIVDRLVARADVLVQSLHHGAAEALGLGAAQLRARDPRLIYCSITAFGTEGPDADQPGYDPLMQARGGIMSITGHPGQPPVRVPVSMVDMGTGMWAVTAILGALRERDRTGRGAEITTSLFDTALAWGAIQLTGYLANGVVPGPQGSGTNMISPYGAFPTRDGWFMLGAGSDALFARAAAALDLPELARDPRYADNPGRVRHRAPLAEALAARTQTLTTEEITARLRAAGVPSAAIQTMDQVARDPQTDASGMVLPLKHPRLDDFRTVPMPVRWDGERPVPTRVPPLLGEHTAEVLAELGYDPAAIQRLAADHVIGLPDA